MAPETSSFAPGLALPSPVLPFITKKVPSLIVAAVDLRTKISE